MSAAKSGDAKKTAASGSKVGQLLRRQLRRLLLVAIAIGAVGGGSYAVWQAVRSDVLRHDSFRLSIEQWNVTPTPPWIRADVRQECFTAGGFENDVWLHDPHLAERISKTFELHPWVEHVERVSLRGASVQIDLKYRRPVCMVEVVPGGVFPVDVAGVLLPKDDFTPAEARQYPRLTGILTPPAGLVGMPWGDLHVVGGAEIAAVLADTWADLRLDAIAPLDAAAPDVIFELIPRGSSSRGKDRIVWGHAPGTTRAGEPAVGDKLARLKQFVAESAAVGNSRGPRELDLRLPLVPHTALSPQSSANE